MKHLFKSVGIIIITLFLSCNADDEQDQVNNDLVSKFTVNEAFSYLTPNGYCQAFNIGDDIDHFILRFIDGELLPVSEEGGIACPFAINLNQGVTIRLRSYAEDAIAPGNYQFVDNGDRSGVTFDAEIFYGFRFEDNCFGFPEEKFQVTSGDLTISIDNDIYTIRYDFATDEGRKIQGVFHGPLEKQLLGEW